MNTLHFDYEKKRKKTNVAIAIVAVITLLCTGIGCSYMMKQTGSDPVNQTLTGAESDQTTAF